MGLVLIAKEKDQRWIIVKKLLQTPKTVTLYCFSAHTFDERKERYLKWVNEFESENLNGQIEKIDNFLKKYKDIYTVDIHMV